MLSREPLVLSNSHYYNHQPSKQAKRSFFYPICVGNFHYAKGYQQTRFSYDSFLLLYMKSGAMEFVTPNGGYTAREQDFVLLDCYQPHSYEALADSQCIWIHFDGPVARAYYDLLSQRIDVVFSLLHPQAVTDLLEAIYQSFKKESPVVEAYLSKQMTDLLTNILTDQSCQETKNEITDQIIPFIRKHFTQEITVEALADMAALSPYHFIRVFKKETGYTPHQYLIATRIHAAKYLLRTTSLTVKDICYQTGFSQESIFCTAFKKNVGCTPEQFRRKI